MTTLLTIVIFIIVFSIIVIFHELGHFWLAKANGIQVNEFSLGLGPTIWGFKKGETKYSIKALPFGGACMMEGEDDDSDNPRAFPNKNVWQRISVVFAGPFFNFIMAFVVIYILLCINGYVKPVLSGIEPGYPAEAAGLQAGDEIIGLNGYNVHFAEEIQIYLAVHKGEEIKFTVLRDGEKVAMNISPKLTEEGNYLYGFSYLSADSYVKGNAWENVSYSFYKMKYYIYATVESLKMLFTGGASFNDLSGPVGIVKEGGMQTAEVVKSAGVGYGILYILEWVALLSANLGVMNLLPIPALDGGRLLFLIIEAIRRKRIDPQKEGIVHGIGIVLLLLLMVVVMFNDIRKIFM